MCNILLLNGRLKPHGCRGLVPRVNDGRGLRLTRTMTLEPLTVKKIESSQRHGYKSSEEDQQGIQGDLPLIRRLSFVSKGLFFLRRAAKGCQQDLATPLGIVKACFPTDLEKSTMWTNFSPAAVNPPELTKWGQFKGLSSASKCV